MGQKEQLSGHTYISARIRGEEYPLHNTKLDVKINFNKLRVVPSNRCDHTRTICHTAECVESWGLGDWQLFLQRTRAGRDLIKDLDLTDDDLEVLKQGTFPSLRHLPSCDTVERHSRDHVPTDNRKGPRVRIHQSS